MQLREIPSHLLAHQKTLTNALLSIPIKPPLYAQTHTHAQTHTCTHTAIYQQTNNKCLMQCQTLKFISIKGKLFNFGDLLLRCLISDSLRAIVWVVRGHINNQRSGVQLSTISYAPYCGTVFCLYLTRALLRCAHFGFNSVLVSTTNF